MTSSGRPSAIFLPDTSTTRRCEKCMTARMMCSIRMTVVPRSLSRISSDTMSPTSECDSPAIASSAISSLGSAAMAQELVAALVGLSRAEAAALARIDGIKQRHFQVVGDRHAHEGPRQLEAARHAEPGARMGRQAREAAALEGDAAGLVGECAAQAIDERALARAVRPDQ